MTKNIMGGATVRSVLAQYTGVGLKTALQFAYGIVMARLLGPEPYGIFYLAMLPVGIGVILSDAGFSAVIIRSESMDAELLGKYHYWQIVISAGCYLFLVAVCSVAFWIWFGKPQAVAPMLLASLTMVILASTAVKVAVLKKQMAFDVIQRATVLSYFFSYVLIGIPMALALRNVWALVSAMISQALVYAFLINKFSSIKFAREFSAWPKRGTRLALNVTGAAILNWLTGIIDSLLIQKMFDSVTLGVYGRFQTITVQMGTLLSSPLASVLHSANCRSGETYFSIRRRWLLMQLGVIASGVAMIYIYLLCGQSIIRLLFGEGWVCYAGILLPMAVMAVPSASILLNAPVMYAVGRQSWDFFITLLFVMIYICVYVDVPSGIEVVNYIWIFCMVLVVRAIVGGALVLVFLSNGDEVADAWGRI